MFDSYDWDALDWLEGRCMDMGDAPDREYYPEEEEE